MAFLNRLYHTIRLCIIRSGTKRAQYVKRKGLYNHIGENVLIMPRKVPLYSELIRLHDNVKIASKVSFITHDVIHSMLNIKHKTKRFTEKIGCIEIMENVFIGSNVIIMYDVKIGANTVVAAGSIVTKDIPENSIVAGIPAKVIGNLSDYTDKLINEPSEYPSELRPKGLNVNKELADSMWGNFEEKRRI